MLPQVFIFIGRSGSGKGTQAKLLIEYLKKVDPARDTLYVQTGAELREFIKGDGLTQKKTKDMYDKGGLMLEFITVYAWAKVLVEKYKGDEHLIFDGTPRKLHEAGVLHSIFDFYTFDKPVVIHIEISSEEALARLLARKRQDDTEDEVRRRLSWYETDVAPTVEYYRHNPAYRFLEIDGHGSTEDIGANIAKKIGLE
jgi:adenylate kinase